MGAMASIITDVSIVCSSGCSWADQRKHHSPASLAFVRGIHRWPVNSLHKGPVTGKMFQFDDVIMWRFYTTHWHRDKMATIVRRYFKINFLVCKLFCVHSISNEICFQCSSQQQASIGSDNVLARHRRNPLLEAIMAWFTDVYMGHQA